MRITRPAVITLTAMIMLIGGLGLTACGTRAWAADVRREAAAAGTPHIDAVASAIRQMEQDTGSDTSEGVLWRFTCANEGFGLRHNITIVPSKGGAGGCPATMAPEPGPGTGGATVLAVGRAGYIDNGRVAGRNRNAVVISSADRPDSGCIVPPLPNPMNGDAAWDGNNPSDTALRALVASAQTEVVGSAQQANEPACRNLVVAPFRYADTATWPTSGKPPGHHAKTISVDDSAFYAGSQNAYPNQLQEFGWIIEDPAAMADFRSGYLDPLVEYSSKAALPCT